MVGMATSRSGRTTLPVQSMYATNATERKTAALSPIPNPPRIGEKSYKEVRGGLMW